MEDHLESNNSRQVWQGIQHITNYRANLRTAEGDALLAEELNHFSAHFEVKPPEAATPQPASHSDTILTVEEHEVRRHLQMCAEGLCGPAGGVLY